MWRVSRYGLRVKTRNLKPATLKLEILNGTNIKLAFRKLH